MIVRLQGVDGGLMLTRVPSEKQAEVQSLLGMTSVLPTLVTPIIGTSIYANASTPGAAYNHIAIASMIAIVAAFVPFVLNWTYLYGDWSATPTGQQHGTALL